MFNSSSNDPILPCYLQLATALCEVIRNKEIPVESLLNEDPLPAGLVEDAWDLATDGEIPFDASDFEHITARDCAVDHASERRFAFFDPRFTSYVSRSRTSLAAA